MGKLRTGDRVMLILNRFGDSTFNPVWGGNEGKVMGTLVKCYNKHLEVLWDNGRRNTYQGVDLAVCKDKKEYIHNLIKKI